MILIGLEPFASGGGYRSAHRGPSNADVGANVITRLPIYQLAQDLRRLVTLDALRWLRRHLRFWCRQASHDLTIDG